MFESLVKLSGMLIAALSGIEKIKKADKKIIGRELAKLYLALSDIIENGEAILLLLGNAQKGVKVNTSTLMELLIAQAEKIRRIQSVIEKSRLETVLKIHLPQLVDFEILLESKLHALVVLKEQLKDPKLSDRSFHPMTPINNLYGIRPEPHLVPPTEATLQRSYSRLNELKRLAGLLRQFLVEKFEIDEII